MSNPNQNKPLDIWGEPVGEKRDCFYCGNMFFANDSDAPSDYRTTYCSLHCYEQDHLQMQMAASAAERIENANTESSNVDTESDYTTSKIGNFILKVKKEQKP